MEGLTAKVFRTYNASFTLQQQLKELTNRKSCPWNSEGNRSYPPIQTWLSWLSHKSYICTQLPRCSVPSAYARQLRSHQKFAVRQCFGVVEQPSTDWWAHPGVSASLCLAFTKYLTCFLLIVKWYGPASSPLSDRWCLCCCRRNCPGKS